MGGGFLVYRLYAIEQWHLLLATRRPLYSNARVPDEARALAEEDAKVETIIAGAPTATLLGQFEGSPVGERLHEGSGPVSLWVAQTAEGPPWMVLGVAASEDEFWAEMDDVGCTPLRPARQIDAYFVKLPDEFGNPFCEVVAWPAAGVLAIGVGDAVSFLARDAAAPTLRLPLGDDFFGYFGIGDGLLCVLGWRHVVAVDPDLAVRWVARDVAVDGILWRGCQGGRVRVSAEMDPPGGWVDVVLDAATGRELGRGPGV
jgi:hypothetical protein